MSNFHREKFFLRAGRIAFGALILASLLLGSLFVSGARAGGTDLFGDGSAYDAIARPLDAHMARARYVTVNTAMLFGANGKPLGKGVLPEITLNIFDDATFTGRVSRAWQDRWGAYWTGSLNGVAGGYFHLTVADGIVMVHVASPRGVYEVAYTSDGQYRAIQIDQSKFVDEIPSAKYPAPGPVLSEKSLGPNADSGEVIDIMVAYTDDARSAAGGTAAMKAMILTALNETNVGYANSGVTPRLRLVYIKEYPYGETGKIEKDLDRFMTNGDGFFDTIHGLRDTYAADMVSLIVENGGGYCGLAAAIQATAATAFQVTERACATGYYSFGHEFGHLQGARHDVYVDPENTPYSYGHGFVYLPSRWRTIMAYDDECVDTTPFTSCTRIQYWSNPAKNFGGIPTGMVTTKNYLALNNTAFTVANFRTGIIGDDFNSSFNGTMGGWYAVTGAWANAGSTTLRSSGLANNSASVAHSDKYGDVIFEVKMKRTGSCLTCANRLIVRGDPNNLVANKWKPAYYFQYANNGTFSVYEYTSSGAELVKKAWSASATIVPGGWNTLKVVASGSSLKFYINGVLVWAGADDSLVVGQLGIGYYRDSTAGLLDVDWAKGTNAALVDSAQGEQPAPSVEVGGGSIDQSR